MEGDAIVFQGHLFLLESFPLLFNLNQPIGPFKLHAPYPFLCPKGMHLEASLPWTRTSQDPAHPFMITEYLPHPACLAASTCCCSLVP